MYLLISTIGALFDVLLRSAVLCNLIEAFVYSDGTGNAAELFEKVERSVKVKLYSEAIDDLNTAIEADPTLSEAYFRRASILRQICRLGRITFF